MTTNKFARANAPGLRQRTQFTCVATSITSALRALGKDVTEDQVNKILGGQPLKGSRWEEALACIQYFGCRGTLVVPATLEQLRDWTDKGYPVLISWNPEGRPWSHASVVVEVDAGDNVHIMDPNIPDPSETFRVVPRGEFFKKWGEDWERLIVRRPALVVTLEVDEEGRQVTASRRPLSVNSPSEKERDKTQTEYGSALPTGEEHTASRENNMNWSLQLSEFERGLTASTDYAFEDLSIYEMERELTASSEKDSKFERGEDVPLSELPEELQENVENPPPKVEALKKKLQKKKGSNPPRRRMDSRWRKGEKVPLHKLPEEFQEMNKNPPESVLRVREEMMGGASEEKGTKKKAALNNYSQALEALHHATKEVIRHRRLIKKAYDETGDSSLEKDLFSREASILDKNLSSFGQVLSLLKR